ncbi:MAG TPA: hypothetical protein VI522_03750 [Gammaproteobacteria bacterium]|nr:hypothetical protein [Gammaproteobacteria bacterium]
MKTKALFTIAIVGIIAGVTSVMMYNQKIKVQAPLAVNYNPYTAGIYATGIVESFQAHGSNVNMYSEVSSRITDIMVQNGDSIQKGTPLMALDDTIQQGIVEKDLASIRYAKAELKNAEDQLAKINIAYDINPKSVSKYDRDNAVNAVKMAKESVAVAQGQYDADKALLDKFIIKSPIDGLVLRIVPAVGDYSSAAIGTYDPYTQGFLPPIQLGVATDLLQVRTYVDEILTPRLPDPAQLEATLFIRGLENKSVPLEFESIQPFTIPNIELSNQRNERVDVRVLPIIFKFTRPEDVNLFPGQLVDVYIKEKS